MFYSDMFAGKSLLFLWTAMTALTLILEPLSAVKTKRNGRNGSGEKILSRRRRYLVFPEGSSLQLVYDSAVTIPDYTLLVVTGVTVSLAWGLPHEPTYPEDELMDQYQNGTLPLLLRRNDKNVTKHKHIKKTKNGTTRRPTSTTQSTLDRQHLLNMFQKFYAEYPLKHNSIRYDYGYKSDYGHNYMMKNNSRIRDRYYFGEGTSSVPNRMKYQSASIPSSSSRISIDRNFDGQTTGHHPIGGNRQNAALVAAPLTITNHYNPNPYAEFAKYLTQTYFQPWQEAQWAEKPVSKKTTKAPSTKSTTTEFRPIIRKLHTVYPAMGKRSIPDEMATYEDKFYLDHHRQTRHELFKLIEKYVYAKGFNGTACVLKTLCEVGQRRDDKKPGSFLTEIVRAIFSLPKAQLKPAQKTIHQNYDVAHSTEENCAEKFSDCSESIWDAGFLLEMIK